jgi:hypothetical protein
MKACSGAAARHRAEQNELLQLRHSHACSDSLEKASNFQNKSERVRMQMHMMATL